MTEPTGTRDPNTSRSLLAESHIQHLKKLQTSFVPLSLTEKQEHEKHERKRGRYFWEDILVQYRREAPASLDVEEECEQFQPFRFLDLPAELRDIVYRYYLEDTQIIENGNDMQQARKDKSWKMQWHYMQAVPTHYHAEQQQSRIDIEELMVDQDGLSDMAYNAYVDYIEAHTRLADVRKPCQHENHARCNVVCINERGNICEDLPFLAQTCHLILGEMWPLCFSRRRSTVSKEDGSEKAQESTEIEYHARVRNFDYLPLFRFLQMLRRYKKGIAIKGHFVQIVLEGEIHQRSKRNTHKTRFEKVERLFAMHWLDNLPLWCCLTGLPKEAVFDKKRSDAQIQPRVRRNRGKKHLLGLGAIHEADCCFVPHRPPGLARDLDQVP